ncbi:helix-turn-helix transcriptional regulator [Natrinema halophilum]|uniref:Uncharacterized protein n=1 Tax=Natrinema halophilum TaxID=1699371 RepID=A0A7D5GIP3_9EURY|nr:hypothetical protein [Natrinema halophilum]QLG50054.1 hypothetical protein HYG82_14915 [Natrinema halophilum]
MDVRGLRALVCVLVVVACTIAFVPGPAAVAADHGAQRAALQEDGNESIGLEDADQIHVDVFIAENGTALMTVDYQFHLDDENGSAAQWESLRSDIRSNPDEYVTGERTKWSETLTQGENRTDRDMTLSNLSITTEENSAPRPIGHAKVTFQWSSFAHVELNRIDAGSALSGFTLDDGTTLQLRWPEEYTIYENDGERQIDPSPDGEADDSVTWKGSETTFTDDQPRIELIKDGDTGAKSTPSNEGPAMPWAIVLLTLSLLAVVGIAGWLVGRKRNGAVGAGAKPETARRTDGSADTMSNAPDGPPPELLSNEERVLRLLENRGGRIKQQEVVSELDWTEAKTSQVVGDLREDDEIDVFRIGRENVLALPDEE